jgi:hypothetical protein
VGVVVEDPPGVVVLVVAALASAAIPTPTPPAIPSATPAWVTRLQREIRWVATKRELEDAVAPSALGFVG